MLCDSAHGGIGRRHRLEIFFVEMHHMITRSDSLYAILHVGLSLVTRGSIFALASFAVV